MKTLLLLALLTFPALPATACINVEGTDLHGEFHRTEGRPPDQVLMDAVMTDPEDKLQQLIAHRPPAEPGSVSQKEFEAVKELLSRNQDRAIDLLQQIEAENPGRYSTAANLGTAYELKGDLDSALKWIQEGVRRDPKSHHGSEWVHVEILKARIQLRDNPDHLKNHRVIPVPDTLDSTTTITIGGQPRGAREIHDAIFYQLQERMVFVKPPDPVVADLIYTFGMIEARINLMESARRLMSMANTYEFANPSLITDEINRYDEAVAAEKRRKLLHNILWGVAGIFIPLCALAYAWKKRQFFLTTKAYRTHRAANP